MQPRPLNPGYLGGRAPLQVDKTKPEAEQQAEAEDPWGRLCKRKGATADGRDGSGPRRPHWKPKPGAKSIGTFFSKKWGGLCPCPFLSCSVAPSLFPTFFLVAAPLKMVFPKKGPLFFQGRCPFSTSPLGCGSKLNHQGTAGFGPSCHLPGSILGTYF